MNAKNFYYLILICFLFSCNDSNSVEAVLTKITDDQTINDTEIKQLEAKPQKFAAVLTNGKVDIKKLQKELVRYRLPKVAINITTEVYQKPVYNVFLENSGSMDGYVKGITGFETSIYNFLSDINTNNNVTDSLHLFYINSKKINFDLTVKDFIEKLEPSTFRARGGDRSNSDIEQIVNEIVNETSENQVGVFISDCLFSLKRVNNVEEYLINQSIGIKNIFAKKTDEIPDFATLVIQLSSNFTGRFYTYNNKVENFKNQPRPYYVWIMGNHTYIKDLMAKIDLETSLRNNILNYYCWSSLDNNDLEYRTTTLNKIGNFSPDRENPLTKIVDISRAKREPNKGIFQFSVAMDLKGYGLHPNYINDKKNYILSDENYEVYEVRAITEKEKKQLNYPVDYSHVMLIRSTKSVATILEISLKQEFPNWIEEWHWEPSNETKTYKPEDEFTKTFGLKYLLEGVDNAYKGTTQHNNTFFTISITIEN